MLKYCLTNRHELRAGHQNHKAAPWGVRRGARRRSDRRASRHDAAWGAHGDRRSWVPGTPQTGHCHAEGSQQTSAVTDAHSWASTGSAQPRAHGAQALEG